MAIFSIFAFVWVNSAILGHPDGRSVGRSVAASARRRARPIDDRSAPRDGARATRRATREDDARAVAVDRAATDDGDGAVRDATDDRSDS